MTTTDIDPAIIAELGFTLADTAFDARLISQAKYWMRQGKLFEIEAFSPQELRDAIADLHKSADEIEFRMAWYESGKWHHGGADERYSFDIPVDSSPLMVRLVELEAGAQFVSPDEDEFLANTYTAIENDPIKRLALSWIALTQTMSGSHSALANVRWNLNNRRYPECSPAIQATVANLRSAVEMIAGLIGFDGPYGTPSLREVLDQIKQHGGTAEKWQTPTLARDAVKEIWNEVPAFSVHAVAEAPKIHFLAR